MQFQALSIPQVLELIPARHGDHRGYFSETYNKQNLQNIGIDAEFVQDNHSLSAEKGTLRGLHFQAPPFAQGKLVRVVAGSILDVAVDIRVGSPTYGSWVSLEVSADKGNQIWVPEGFAHGFLTLEPNTQVTYKVTNYYAPEHDHGIAWNDEDLGVDWRVSLDAVVLSEKDTNLPKFADSPQYFTA